jgi:hypothetical protein
VTFAAFVRELVAVAGSQSRMRLVRLGILVHDVTFMIRFAGPSYGAWAFAHILQSIEFIRNYQVIETCFDFQFIPVNYQLVGIRRKIVGLVRRAFQVL